jgi:hypothetical protein
MYSQFFRKLVWFVFGLATCASAQRTDSCTELMKFKGPGVEITKATPIAAGTTEPNPYGRATVLPFQPTAASKESSIAASVWAAKSLESTSPWRCLTTGTAIF